MAWVRGTSLRITPHCLSCRHDIRTPCGRLLTLAADPDAISQPKRCTIRDNILTHILAISFGTADMLQLVVCMTLGALPGGQLPQAGLQPCPPVRLPPAAISPAFSDDWPVKHGPPPIIISFHYELDNKLYVNRTTCRHSSRNGAHVHRCMFSLFLVSSAVCWPL